MEDNLSDHSRDIKSKIDDLYLFVSKIKYTPNHPLRVINASKALIGIDIKNPPYVLLKWLEKYLHQFELNFQAPSIAAKQNTPDILSYLELEKFIDLKDLPGAYNYLEKLLLSASPASIAEFLFEYSINKSVFNILFSWAVIRSIQFLGEEQGYAILYSGISNLIDNKNVHETDELLLYEMKCHYFQMRSANMVRSSKIISKLDPFIIDLDDDIFKRIHISLPNELIGNLVKRGINGIHDYLLLQSIDTLSIDMILKLDSIRSLISFSKYNINQIVEESFVPGMIND